jgi:hypothetical protein
VDPFVEADGVLEVGVLQPESPGFLVHPRHECVHAGLSPSANVFGKRVSGVVARGDQGRHQQLPNAQGIAGQEADVAVGRRRVSRRVFGDRHLLVEVGPVERGHDLGGRGYRELF